MRGATEHVAARINDWRGAGVGFRSGSLCILVAERGFRISTADTGVRNNRETSKILL
jgi:hypothetical protein